MEAEVKLEVIFKQNMNNTDQVNLRNPNMKYNLKAKHKGYS